MIEDVPILIVDGMTAAFALTRAASVRTSWAAVGGPHPLLRDRILTRRDPDDYTDLQWLDKPEEFR
jgi:hypothetical protein